MKKGLKKQVEIEVMEAVSKVLTRHNKKALDKTKKAVKSAAKTVAKKFSKIIKGIEDNKKPAKKRKSPKSSAVKKEVRTRRPYRRRATPVTENGFPDLPVTTTSEIPEPQHP